MGVYHGMDGQSRNTCALENVCASLQTKRFYAMTAALLMRSDYLPMFHMLGKQEGSIVNWVLQDFLFLCFVQEVEGEPGGCSLGSKLKIGR